MTKDKNRLKKNIIQSDFLKSERMEVEEAEERTRKNLKHVKKDESPDKSSPGKGL